MMAPPAPPSLWSLGVSMLRTGARGEIRAPLSSLGVYNGGEGGGDGNVASWGSTGVPGCTSPPVSDGGTQREATGEGGKRVLAGEAVGLLPHSDDHAYWVHGVTWCETCGSSHRDVSNGWGRRDPETLWNGAGGEAATKLSL